MSILFCSIYVLLRQLMYPFAEQCMYTVAVTIAGIVILGGSDKSDTSNHFMSVTITHRFHELGTVLILKSDQDVISLL